jgi:hypothetical protein
MKRSIFSLTFILVAARVGFAQTDNAKPPAPKSSIPASAAPKQEVAPIELKTKSVFAMETNARNPFWPIGWKPAAKISDSPTDHGGDISVNAFVVSSITLEKSGKFAIVNGKIMQEGQTFGLQVGSQTYQITLKRIEDGRVIVARRDQELVVPLRRK